MADQGSNPLRDIAIATTIPQYQVRLWKMTCPGHLPMLLRQHQLGRPRNKYTGPQDLRHYHHHCHQSLQLLHIMDHLIIHGPRQFQASTWIHTHQRRHCRAKYPIIVHQRLPQNSTSFLLSHLHTWRTAMHYVQSSYPLSSAINSSMSLHRTRVST